MDTVLQTTAVIRQRGQLTIPDQIRKHCQWLIPGSVVTLTATANKEQLVIRPYFGIIKNRGMKRL